MKTQSMKVSSFLMIVSLASAGAATVFGQSYSSAGEQSPSGGIPGVDLSRLSTAQRGQVFSVLSNEPCPCGCGHNMLQCRIQDSSCPVSLQRAQHVVGELSMSGAAPSTPSVGPRHSPAPRRQGKHHAPRGGGGSLAPVAVVQLRGQYCTASAPEGWAVSAENPAGSSFGADITRADGAAAAGYMVMGIPAELRNSPWYSAMYATPEQAVMTVVTKQGTVPMQCRPPVEAFPVSGVKLQECHNATVAGAVIYQVHPMADGGYVVVMRTAGTPPSEWRQSGAIALAVARSIQCNVPLKPSTADWTSSGPSTKGRARGKEDSGYSQWLEMENYHDPSTGQNYWVNPSQNWNDTGPRGPGYYVDVGGEQRQLQPGLAQ